ncbi:MAG: branched-chain amino acid transaminase [Acidobacteria bacterium]|nr:branched-chain amino acid transaminase [Acidobacteriota bacterium]
MTIDMEKLEATWVYFEGDFVRLRDARVSILTHAIHYGTAIFEGIRGYWVPERDDLFLFRSGDHYGRWRVNCRILNFDLEVSVPQLCDLTCELIRRNHFRCNVYVRPLAYNSSKQIGIRSNNQYTYSLIALPFGDYFNGSEGLSVNVVSWRRLQDNAIPSRAKICGAYVNSTLAMDEASRNHGDDAILLNEDGHVSEGTTSNIFLVREGKLITPGVSENILEGITRSSIIELARTELGMDVEERSVARSELYTCDEIFLTGTASEVAPVVRVDQRSVGDGRIGSVTTRLRQLYAQTTCGSIKAYLKWVLPVYQGVLLAGDTSYKG